MGKTIVNMGSGNVVDGSKDVVINQSFNGAISNDLACQLDTIINVYKMQYPDDSDGIANLEYAVNYVRNNPSHSPDAALVNLKGTVLKLARDLGLGVLVNAISKAIGLI